MAIRTMDESGASQEEINAFVDKIARGAAAGDRENKLMSAGQVAGMIRGLMTIDEVIKSMTADAKTIVRNLEKTF
jgi:enoyl-[acyl-carrier protein] reductase II